MGQIGNNIKKLRSQKNISQIQLAEKLFVTQQSVSNWERGKSIPDITMLEDMAEILDCDIRELIYGTKEKKKENIIVYIILLAVLTVMLLLNGFYVLYLNLDNVSLKILALIYYLIYPISYFLIGYLIVHILFYFLKISNYYLWKIR